MAQCLFLILGNQLFDPIQIRKKIQLPSDTVFFLREDLELCTYYKFHKHKIIFFLGAMRAFAEECNGIGCKVVYQKLDASDNQTYEEALSRTITDLDIKCVYHFEIEDKFFEARIKKLLENLKVEIKTFRTPMFLNTRPDFEVYLKSQKKPFLKTFYEKQRRKRKILLTNEGTPMGGQWSFDSKNRLPLPANKNPPLPCFTVKISEQVKEVQNICNKLFLEHPGKSDNFLWPVTRKEAKNWLKDFLKNRFENFGPYEDALSPNSDFVFHSALTPYLNTGLLTPDEVIDQALSYARDHNVSLPSVEGFVRQVIGWREFVRGIYQNFSKTQESKNFWGHARKLKTCWYDASTEIPPLDNCIRKAQKFGYAHHIERLMVAGSLMVLCEVAPHEAYKWFMEMFIDSSDWVMVPNVYGMALFSDGGIFATKPYICGSNYYRKMGGYKFDSWCEGVDGLYWGFLQKHRDFFDSNPRLAVITKNLDRMKPDKLRYIQEKGKELRERITW